LIGIWWRRFTKSVSWFRLGCRIWF